MLILMFLLLLLLQVLSRHHVFIYQAKKISALITVPTITARSALLLSFAQAKKHIFF